MIMNGSRRRISQCPPYWTVIVATTMKQGQRGEGWKLTEFTGCVEIDWTEVGRIVSS